MPWFGSVMREGAAARTVDRRTAGASAGATAVPVAVVRGAGAVVPEEPDVPCPAQADRPTASTAMSRNRERARSIVPGMREVVGFNIAKETSLASSVLRLLGA